MKENVRRIVMFVTILAVGVLLIFVDVTFIQLLVLILALACILPVALGLVTIAEIRAGISTFKDQRLKKISFLKKLDDIKLFEGKKGAMPAKAKLPEKPVKAEPAKDIVKKPGFKAMVQSLVTSLKSFSSAIKIRGSKPKKVTEINKMLDSTVSEKVEKPALPAPAAAAASAGLPAPPATGGAGSAANDDDPFLSLTGDDFDAGLLDGLDDEGPASPLTAAPDPGAEAAADTSLPAPELSADSLDMDAAASAILKASGETEESLDQFGGLESGGGADSDLGDLDDINLDDVELDGDMEDEGAVSAAPAAPAPEAPAAPAAAPQKAGDSPGVVKTAWIPSDAPKDMDQQQDQIGTQADMASFASASSGTDEDLLSSIASDVKRSAKTVDISLVRELKDFKAPANEIEKELSDMFQKLNSIKKPQDIPQKTPNPPIK